MCSLHAFWSVVDPKKLRAKWGVESLISDNCIALCRSPTFHTPWTGENAAWIEIQVCRWPSMLFWVTKKQIRCMYDASYHGKQVNQRRYQFLIPDKTWFPKSISCKPKPMQVRLIFELIHDTHIYTKGQFNWSTKIICWKKGKLWWKKLSISKTRCSPSPKHSKYVNHLST